MVSKIKTTLETLKKRLDSNNLLEVQQEDGYIEKVEMIFNPPATEDDLRKLPFSVPKDYEEFLRLHHGGLIFNSPEGGGGLKLLTVDEILEYRAIPGYEDYPANWFPVAYGYDGCYLIITDKKVGRGYLFWMETGNDFEDDMFLGMNFEDFLENIIMAQGSKFWEWGFRIPPTFNF